MPTWPSRSRHGASPKPRLLQQKTPRCVNNKKQARCRPANIHRKPARALPAACNIEQSPWLTSHPTSQAEEAPTEDSKEESKEESSTEDKSEEAAEEPEAEEEAAEEEEEEEEEEEDDDEPKDPKEELEEGQ